jgi:hypothetical protein
MTHHLIQIGVLRSRLEKQPTDSRQNRIYFGDRTLELESPSDRVKEPIASFFEFLDDRTQIDGLICELAIFGDFGLVQNSEAVSLEKFEPASAVEGHHLRVNLFNSVVVEEAEVSFEKLSTNENRPYLRQQIDVEMSNCARRCGNFAPRLGNDPVDEAT